VSAAPDDPKGTDAMRVLTSEAYRRPVYWYAATRILLLLWSVSGIVPYFMHSSVVGDVQTYSLWALEFEHGHFPPASDNQWQYPPGAALVMLVPQVLVYITGVSYFIAFYLFALVADFAVFRLLLGQADRLAREGAAPDGRPAEAHLSGVWAWIVGAFALGPLLFMRYDVIVTALAVGGLTAAVRSGGRFGGGADTAGRRTWNLRGALLGVGAIVKVWPLVLLLGVPPRRTGLRTLLYSVGAALVVTGGLAAAMPGAFTFLHNQSNRGIEVESVLASPFMIASWFGYPVRIQQSYGSFQIFAHGVGLVGSGSLALTAVGFALILWWRVRRLRPERWSPALYADVGLTALLIMVVTSRVLSPQYMIWLMGLAAVCLTFNAPGRRATLMATPAKLIMACVFVTQIEFPILFVSIIDHGFLGTALVAVRNLALIAATVIAVRNLWRGTSGPVPAADADALAAAQADAGAGSAQPEPEPAAAVAAGTAPGGADRGGAGPDGAAGDLPVDLGTITILGAPNEATGQGSW
jgi:Glycosyltransferase family 87